MNQAIENFIWHTYESDAPYWRRALLHFLRIMVMVIRDIRSGMLTLRAMSLVYTTLLSFVPLIAVSFSVLKGFGVHNQVEPMLLGLLEPLGDKSAEVTDNIVGFVENMKIGVLGALGLGMLMYTVISLIQKIESAFNFTWRISGNRSLSQRFSNYLSVVMVGPVLIFSAVGITASLKSHAIVTTIESLPYMGDLIEFGARLLPYLLIIGAFTFVYVLVPNTRVKLKSALYGALVAGILWRLTGNLFASFAGGSTSYTAIYSGFAILLLFMIWLYLGWLILLIGATISFYHQHPECLRLKPEPTSMSAVLRETLALQLMQEIGRAFHSAGVPPPTAQNLSEHMLIPHNMTQSMLNNLMECGLIVQTADEVSQYVPGRSMRTIKLVEILQCARLAEDNELHTQLRTTSEIDQLQLDIEQSQQQLLQDKTLSDLLESEKNLESKAPGDIALKS